MTGDVPKLLHQWVITPPVTPQPIHLPDTLDAQGDPRLVGCGFVVERSLTTPLPAGNKAHLGGTVDCDTEYSQCQTSAASAAITSQES